MALGLTPNVSFSPPKPEKRPLTVSVVPYTITAEDNYPVGSWTIVDESKGHSDNVGVKLNDNQQARACQEFVDKLPEATFRESEVECKFCLDCQTWKTLGDFNKSPNGYKGLQSYCRLCGAKRSKAARERKKLVQIK